MKRAFIFILIIFTVLFTSTAFAADATYQNGIITVSTGDSGFFEILIDGVGTGRWVGTGMPSNTFSWELAEGKHTVRLYSPDGDAGSSVSLVVGNADTVQSGNESNSDSTDDLSLKEDAAAVIVAVEPTCIENGISEDGQVIVALGHRYVVVSHNDTTNFFECKRCGAKFQAGLKDAVQNRYGNIILDGEGAVADYKAAPGKENETVMTFTLDQEAEKIVVTLDNSLIMQIMREGSSQVEIVNGKTVTVIDLYQISPSWFNTAEKVETYIFTVDSEAQITVQTMVNGELLAAETFAGVTVK